MCREVTPGVLTAERVFRSLVTHYNAKIDTKQFCRCPDRYLFDPATQLCQREGKVQCDQATNPLLLYSFRSALVIQVREENLESFFSQDLTLPRTSLARQSPVQRLYRPVSYPSFMYPRHSPFVFL